MVNHPTIKLDQRARRAAKLVGLVASKSNGGFNLCHGEEVRFENMSATDVINYCAMEKREANTARREADRSTWRARIESVGLNTLIVIHGERVAKRERDTEWVSVKPGCTVSLSPDFDETINICYPDGRTIEVVTV
jgi:hypothetical protein